MTAKDRPMVGEFETCIEQLSGMDPKICCETFAKAKRNKLEDQEKRVEAFSRQASARFRGVIVHEMPKRQQQ